MKKYFFGVLILTFLGTTLALADSEQEINTAIRTGNYKGISAFFKESVELNLPGNEGLYSKPQAEQILKDFFTKNTPKSFTAKHDGQSKDGAKFTIGSLETSTGKYRTYFFLKKEGEIFIIKELRIEKE